MGHHLGRNACPGVRNGQAHPLSRGHPCHRGLLARPHLHPGQGDTQFSPLRHRVPRVGRQVYQHLLEPAGVGVHYVLTGSCLQQQVDGLRQCALQEVHALLGEHPHTHEAGLDGGAAAEVQNLLHQLSGLSCLVEDALQVRCQVWMQIRLFQEHPGVEYDGHQDVVEVVGDTPGQLPEGRHLVLLPHLPLETLPLGEVMDDALITQNVSVIGPPHGRGEPAIQLRPVLLA